MRDLAYPLRALVGMGMKIPVQWVQDREIADPKANESDEVLTIVDSKAPLPERLRQLRLHQSKLAVLNQSVQPENNDLQVLQLSKQANIILSV